jgi:maltose O-acetyltransferase
MGVQIGSGCKIMNHVMIDHSHYWLISIGNNVTIAPNVHILAHDASMKNELTYTKIGLVKILDNVFIGSGSIILPGVCIGKNAIVGAGSVVTRDVPENAVVAGNPARCLTTHEVYMKKQQALMCDDNCFSEDYTLRKNVTREMKEEMIAVLEKHQWGFID